MPSHINEGVFALLYVLPIAATIYFIFFIVLLLLKKRKFNKSQILKYIGEFLFVLWTCSILKITGIIGMTLQSLPSFSNVIYEFTKIPFVGSSVRMVILNFLLFVPFGILFPIAVKSDKWKWYKALLIGLGFSVCIETLQIFAGRFFEVDDIIANALGTLSGYFVWESFFNIKHSQFKKGIIKLVLTLLLSITAIHGLLFTANPNKVGQMAPEEYSEITGDEEADKNIKKIKLIMSGKECVSNSLYDNSLDFADAYGFMGVDIGNSISQYKVIKTDISADEVLKNSQDAYIEIIYKNPQTFCFENRQDFEMTDIVCLLYDVINGDVWYGKSAEKLNYHLKYHEKDFPFIMDTDLYDIIKENTSKE